jgi:light-regulated signal transduction histidine kinase (bacteriophytochrome)
MARDRIDVTELARQTAAGLRAAEAHRRVEFSCTDGLVGEGDQELVRIILENLLTNAWKFTSGVEYPQIEVGGGEHDGRVEFFVRDNGVGFDMDYAEQLFVPFQRLHTFKQNSRASVSVSQR